LSVAVGTPQPLAGRGAWLLGWLALACAFALAWSRVHFVCDDAYIVFRYARNLRLGLGPVFNPPPFHPAEGYTSPLWLAFLWLAWVLGCPPPMAAQALGLLCGLGTLALAVHLARRGNLGSGLGSGRPWYLLLLGLGLALNHTFVAWSGAGLETPLFGLLALAWTGELLLGDRGTAALARSAALAALLLLTRPEGALFVVATLATAPACWRRDGAGRTAAALAPLLLPLAHLLWRHGYYGDWLPTTFYAKVQGGHPDLGWRYGLLFCLEYLAWLWMPALFWAIFGAQGRPHGARLAAALWPGAGIAAFLLLWVGGDHFEFRPLLFLIPPAALGLAWAGDRLPRWAAWTAAAAFLLGGLVLPWARYFASPPVDPGREIHFLEQPLAPLGPAWTRPYLGMTDQLQAQLVDHYDAVRVREHQAFAAYQLASLTPLAALDPARLGQLPVVLEGSVGVLSWVLPGVRIVDYFGLNNYVIAHAGYYSPVYMMAHTTSPPDGYVASLRPLFQVVRRPGQVGLGGAPSTDPERPQKVADLERRYVAWVQAGAPLPEPDPVGHTGVASR
jgi:arabinofuranosyltransferase